jgi:hypothetical protein
MKTLFRLLVVLSFGLVVVGCSSSTRVGTRHHGVGISGSVH